MATAGTLCTDVHVKAKVKNISADIDNGDTAETDVWITNAEAEICTIARYDFVTNFASLDAINKLLLRDFCSSHAAIMAITYDMAGFTTRIEAEDMINILRDSMLRQEAIIRDFKAREFILNG